MIYIGLKRGTGFYSMLIRTWTRSKYSHAMIVEQYIPNDDMDAWLKNPTNYYTVYESTAKHGTIERICTLDELYKDGVELHDYKKFFTPLDSVPHGYEGFRKKIKQRIGQGYDWLAIYYSRIFNIDRQDATKTFCFEFVAEVFGMQKAWRWTGRTFQDKLEGVIYPIYQLL